MKKPDKIEPSSWVAQAKGLLTTELDGETVMMSLAQAAYYGLDNTARHIWMLISHPRQVADVCEQLIAEYAVDRETCVQQVCAFLADLEKEGLVQVLQEPQPD